MSDATSVEQTKIPNPANLMSVRQEIEYVATALSVARTDTTTHHTNGTEDYERRLTKPIVMTNINLKDEGNDLARFLRLIGFSHNRGQTAKSLLVKEEKPAEIADISIQPVLHHKAGKNLIAFEIKRTDTLKARSPEQGFSWVSVEPVETPGLDGKNGFRGTVKVTIRDGESGNALAYDPRQTYDQLEGDSLYVHIRQKQAKAFTKPEIDGTSTEGIKLLNALLTPIIKALR